MRCTYGISSDSMNLYEIVQGWQQLIQLDVLTTDAPESLNKQGGESTWRWEKGDITQECDEYFGCVWSK